MYLAERSPTDVNIGAFYNSDKEGRSTNLDTFVGKEVRLLARHYTKINLVGY